MMESTQKSKSSIIFLAISILLAICSLIPFHIVSIYITLIMCAIYDTFLIIYRKKEKTNMNLASIFVVSVALINAITFMIYILYV